MTALSELVQRIPVHGTRAIAAAAAGHEDVINLTLGEPDFATPAHIAEAGIAAIRDGRTRYAPGAGLPALRDAAATSVSLRDVKTEDATAFARALASRDGGVACAPGDAFGPAAAGMLRLSLAAAPEAIEEGIRRIGRALREYA